jgi:hypothetical protein
MTIAMINMTTLTFYNNEINSKNFNMFNGQTWITSLVIKTSIIINNIKSWQRLRIERYYLATTKKLGNGNAIRTLTI